MKNNNQKTTTMNFKTMSGDAFKATYTYKNVEYKNFISAKVNDKGDSMTGTYSGETEGNVLGSITMKKK